MKRYEKKLLTACTLPSDHSTVRVHSPDEGVHMPTKGTSVKGIRLPDPIWDAVDGEAESLGMSRNEYVARKLKAGLPVAFEVRESDKIVRDSSLTLKEVPEDDD